MAAVTPEFRAYRTRSTLLASALYAVGVNFIEGEPLVHFMDSETGQEYTVWQFEQESRDGKYKTNQLAAAWKDDEWFKENPDHPFAYALAALDMRTNLVDVVKQGKRLIRIKKDGNVWMVPEGGRLHRKLTT